MLSSATSSSVSTLLSRSSSSSSSNSSHNLFINSQNSTNTTTQKTMEEVWKDITINSLPNTPISQIHHPTPTTSHYRGFILQDFLNGAGNMPNSSVDSPPSQPSLTQPTTTEFQFLDSELLSSESHQFQLQGNSSVHSLIAGVAAFDALAFGGGGGGGGGGGFSNKKRVSEVDEDGSVNRRHKRMIKNRESAARSRARKQAYITELELEVDNLRKENKMLRKQQRQLIEAPPAQLPKKHGLHRTSTAPF